MGKHRWPTTGDPWDPPLRTPVASQRREYTQGRTGRARPGTWPGPRRHDVQGGSVRDESVADIGAGKDAGPLPDGIVEGRDEAPGPAAAPAPWEARDAEEEPPAHPRVQWRVARSAALVFLGVALAVGAALFLVRSSEPSAAAMSVQLGTGAGTGDGATGEAGGGASDSGTPPGPAGEDAAAERAVTGALVDRSPIGTRSASPSDDGAGGGAGDGQTIVVYVTGAVVAPGVVTVPAGTRLFEVLDRAGGPLPEADLEGMNLAAIAADGHHVHLLAVGEEPRPGVAAPDAPSPPQGGSGTGDGSAATTGGTGGTAGPLDINTATLADIETLPRVGPVLGQRIIDWRDEHGPFAQASDLDAVPGIGPAMLEGILPLISVR